MHSCPKKWAAWLPLVEYWYNTSFHSALGRTPFEVLYGYPPRTLGISVNDCASADLESWLKERATMCEVIRQHLLRAQQRMKHQADKHRSERTFQVGDLVYLKLQPYIQQSVEVRGNQKLAFSVLWSLQDPEASGRGCLQIGVTNYEPSASCGACVTTQTTCASTHSSKCFSCLASISY